jgi:hypothetical protein
VKIENQELNGGTVWIGGWVDECGGFGWMEADLLLEEKSRQRSKRERDQQSERERDVLRGGERERKRRYIPGDRVYHAFRKKRGKKFTPL